MDRWPDLGEKKAGIRGGRKRKSQGRRSEKIRKKYTRLRNVLRLRKSKVKGANKNGTGTSVDREAGSLDLLSCSSPFNTVQRC